MIALDLMNVEVFHDHIRLSAEFWDGICNVILGFELYWYRITLAIMVGLRILLISFLMVS